MQRTTDDNRCGRRPRWDDVAARLAHRRVAAPGTPAARFWGDFRARLHLYPQATPADSARDRRAVQWGWTLGSLAASSLLVLAGWFLFLQPTPVQAEFAIHSYEITPDHGTVMLWQDAASQATILWISDLDDPAPDMETEP